MHDTGCLGLVHWDDPEGGYREGGGGRVQDGEHVWRIHVDIWQNQYNIVKLKNKLKENFFTHILFKDTYEKHVKYHVRNELPAQVRCTMLDAWGWCTGTTQRDGMGREEGGGFRMGNTCIPVADSFRYLAKLIQLWKI